MKKEVLKGYDDKYWVNRLNLELKHLLIANKIVEYFKLRIDAKVFDFGCGAGQLVHSFRELNVDAKGYDPSEAAVNNPYGLSKGQISTGMGLQDLALSKYDLVTCIDVLEHVPLEDLWVTLQTIYDLTKRFVVFSICFENDPNFVKDPTHINKHSKLWWKEVLTILGFTVTDAPKDWLYNEQFLICEKREF